MPNCPQPSGISSLAFEFALLVGLCIAELLLQSSFLVLVLVGPLLACGAMWEVPRHPADQGARANLGLCESHAILPFVQS